MATSKTENYGLTLQDNDEFVGIEVTAENFRIIDEELAAAADAVKQAQTEIEALEKLTQELEKEAESIRSELESSGSLSEETEDRLSDIESAISTALSNITNLKTRITAAESDIDTLQNVGSSLISRMTAAEGDIDALESDMDNAKSDIDTLQSDGTSLKSRMTAAEGDIDSLQSDGTSLKSRMKTAEGDIEDHESRVAALEETAGTTEIKNETILSGVQINVGTTINIENLSKFRVVLVKTSSPALILATVRDNGTYTFIDGSYTSYDDSSTSVGTTDFVHISISNSTQKVAIEQVGYKISTANTATSLKAVEIIGLF